MTTYYIASLKHTNKHHEHIVWWAKNQCGYTPVFGDHIGAYDLSDALGLNDGESTLAVPIEVVQRVLQPEPYYMSNGERHRFYDQRGPVVLNDRKSWNRIIANRLDGAWPKQIAPAVFRGRRQAIYWQEPQAA